MDQSFETPAPPHLRAWAGYSIYMESESEWKMWKNELDYTFVCIADNLINRKWSMPVKEDVWTFMTNLSTGSKSRS